MKTYVDAVFCWNRSGRVALLRKIYLQIWIVVNREYRIANTLKLVGPSKDLKDPTGSDLGSLIRP